MSTPHWGKTECLNSTNQGLQRVSSQLVTYLIRSRKAYVYASLGEIQMFKFDQ